MPAYLGILLVAVALGVVVWLARSMGDIGNETALDAPWDRFCKARGLELVGARPLVGEKWPMITGVVGNVSVFIDVFEEHFGTHTATCTRLRASSLHVRPGVLRVCNREGATTSSGRIVRTGDGVFDEELVAFADNDEVVRVLGDATRSALLDLAHRTKLHVEVDDGAVTLLVREVLRRGDDLSLATDALVSVAASRPSGGYR